MAYTLDGAHVKVVEWLKFRVSRSPRCADASPNVASIKVIDISWKHLRVTRYDEEDY